MLIEEYFTQYPSHFLIYVTVVGLLVGSFLNVVIARLPVMLEKDWHAQCRDLLGLPASESEQATEKFNLIVPRSRCPKCGHQITAAENIPVISYLIQGGKCKGCKAKISFRYPAIEVLTAILSLLVAYKFGFSWQTLAGLFLVWSLIAMSFIDIDHQILPDVITLPFLWIGIGLSLCGVFIDERTSIIGTIVGYLSLWSVYWAFKLLTGKEGMGYGDFKLLAMLGAWMGVTAIPAIIVLSSFVGAIIGIAMILILGRDKNIPIPFGPYLAAAGFITFLWGSEINQAYISYFAGPF